MKIVAVDYGLARAGLAAGDDELGFAWPLATLSLDGFKNRKEHLQAIADRVAAEGAGLCVLGLPLLDDGSESLTTRQVKNAAERLARRLACPCVFVNEFLTSREAMGDLEASGLKTRKRKAVLDQAAAVRILESYLANPAQAVPVHGGQAADGDKNGAGTAPNRPRTSSRPDQERQEPCGKS